MIIAFVSLPSSKTFSYLKRERERERERTYEVAIGRTLIQGVHKITR
ncbi:hypothetical protein ACOSB0_00315 [Candidatus Phytoplasma citri]